jgi:hypothetical protein
MRDHNYLGYTVISESDIMKFITFFPSPFSSCEDTILCLRPYEDRQQ